jgi:hypothetical protein
MGRPALEVDAALVLEAAVDDREAPDVTEAEPVFDEAAADPVSDDAALEPEPVSDAEAEATDPPPTSAATLLYQGNSVA